VTVLDSTLHVLPGEDEIAVEEDAGDALQETEEAGSLACEEVDDAEAAAAGLAHFPPDFAYGKAARAAEWVEFGDCPIPAGEGQVHAVEAKEVDLAEGGVEEGVGLILEGYKEERRLGGEVG
jgi:hypothetical protein